MSRSRFTLVQLCAALLAVGSACTTNRLQLTPPPTITACTPMSGSFGATVVCSGLYFNGATEVTFTGAPSAFTVDASSTQFTTTVPLGALTGPITLETNHGNATSPSFTVLGPPAKLVFVQQPSNAASGSPIAPAVSIAIEDASGNVVVGATNAIALAPSGGTLSGTTATLTNGVASFPSLALNARVGSYTLTASSGSLAPATSDPFTISIGAPAQLAFTQQPTDSASGATISPAVSVSVEDSGGNLISSASLSIALTASAGTLSGSSGTAVSGVANYDALSLTGPLGSYTLTATDPSGACQPATSAAFRLSAGAAVQLAFTQVPTSAASGIAMTPAVLVAIEDAAGNLVSTASNSISLGASAGTLVGGDAVIASSGVATFTPTLDGSTSLNPYLLTASAAGLTPATASLTLIAGVPKQLLFTQQPSNPQSGVAMSPPIVVAIADGAGNLVASASALISLSSSPGTLTGGDPTATSAGIATFSQAVLTGSVSHNPYTLTASASGLAPATTTLQLAPGVANAIVFTQEPPSSAQSGLVFTSAVEVSVEDAAGNVVTSSTDEITLNAGDNGTLSGAGPLQVSHGVATFLPTLTGLAGSYTLQASTTDSIAGSLSATSTPFDLLAGAPSQLGFTQLPNDPLSGSPMSLQVSIEDSAGNVVAAQSVTHPVSITLSTDGGTLTNDLTESTTPVSAQFTPTLTGAAGLKTLTATAPLTTLLPATGVINLVNGAPHQLAFTQEPPSSARSGIAMPQVTVSILDMAGNLVTTSTEQIKLSSGGTLTGGGAVAAVNGVATFTPTITGTVGSYVLTASDSGGAGLLPATSTSIQLTAGVASQLAFGTAPASTEVCASAFTPTVTVKVEDSAGNLITSTASASDQITIQPTSIGTVSNGVATASSGIASFPLLTLAGACPSAASHCTLYATATDNLSGSAIQSAPSGNITLSPGSAAALAFTTEPPASEQNRSFTTVVTVEDSCNNVATSSTAAVTMQLENNPGPGTLSGTLVVNAASGIASFGDLSIATGGIGYSLKATSPGLSPAISTPITVPWVTIGMESVLTAGATHSCALVRGGAVCWGDNTSGQLGTNAIASSPVPTPVIGLGSGAQALSAGADFTCAIVSGGVQCWGNNQYGQLGNNTVTSGNTPNATPTPVVGLTAGVQAIATGYAHACALSNGAVWCWGDNPGGELGNNSVVSSHIPVAVTGLTSGVLALTAGEYHTCALLNGGVKCWGNNGNGYGAVGNNQVGVNSLVPAQVTGLTSGVTAIAARGYHTCAVLNGGVTCWGDNGYGELGNNSTTASAVPVTVAGIGSGATAVAVGHDHSCAIVNGAAKCWGLNSGGQLGNNSTANSNLPVQSFGLTGGVQAIAAGGAGSSNGHTCALVNGAIQCWGNDASGQLGNNGSLNLLIPTQTLGMTAGLQQITQSCALINGGAQCWGQLASPSLPTSGVQAISADASGTGCLLVNGAVQCWSGTGAPSPMSGLSSGVQSITTAIRGQTACAVVNGAAKCWGDNSYGLLGNNSTVTSATPVSVTGLTSGVQSISLGDRAACAVVNGGLQCWGDNTYGEVGNNTNAVLPVLVPTVVPSLSSGVAAASAGGTAFVCALANGGAYCWGAGGNGDGQLGNNQPGYSSFYLPNQVTGLSHGVQRLSAGYNGACAIVNGATQCWGNNSDAALGANSAVASSDVPVQLFGGTGAQELVDGNDLGCAVLNGELSCWGYGLQGGLGDGATTDNAIPAPVTALTGLPP